MMQQTREESDDMSSLVEGVLRVFDRVHATLGPGFARDVYRNALVLELERLGQDVQAKLDVEVFYRGEPMGSANADLVVGGRMLVVIDAARFLTADRAGQLAGLVHATGWEAGLLLNFGSVAEHWLVTNTGFSAGSLSGFLTKSG